MSQAPSTFGTMITSRRSPIAPTSLVRSSSTHGESSAFTRVHSAVPPRSVSRPSRASPSRAATLRSAGIASSRLPSTMSACWAIAGSLATIFSFDGSKKWIMREGVTGIWRGGSGAPCASGLKTSRGLRIPAHRRGRGDPAAAVRRTPAMDLTDKRILVAGATGRLGGALADALRDGGADVVTAGRHDCDVALDLADPASPAAAMEAAGRLDAIVVATGNVAFGAVEETPDDVVRALFDVNVIGPIALLRAAFAAPEPPEAVVALSAVAVDHPTAGLAAYSAAKAALSAHLTALRHERRRARTVVLDIRPPHLDTGFETRAIAGEAPKLPAPVPAADAV